MGFNKSSTCSLTVHPLGTNLDRGTTMSHTKIKKLVYDGTSMKPHDKKTLLELQAIIREHNPEMDKEEVVRRSKEGLQKMKELIQCLRHEWNPLPFLWVERQKKEKEKKVYPNLRWQK